MSELAQIALDCLRSGAPDHAAAMLHVDLLSLDDPLGVRSGYRDGGLTSLDVAARAKPFQPRTPALHAAVLACLRAHADAGAPLFLLRLRFAASSAGWSLQRTATQTIAERLQLLGDRAPLEATLRSVLTTSIAQDFTSASLRWNDLPAQLLAPKASFGTEDGTQPLAVTGALADWVARTKQFYADRGWQLDSLSARLGGSGASSSLTVDDYYG